MGGDPNMSPLEVLTKLRTAGGSIVVEGGDLKVSAPLGILDERDRSVLAEHKTRLVELLSPTVSVSQTPATPEKQVSDTDTGDTERDAIRWVEGFNPPEIPIETVEDGSWHEPVRGSFVIPSGARGRLVTDLDRELANDPYEHREIERTLWREKRAGRNAVVVHLDGRVRIVDRSEIRLAPGGGGEDRAAFPPEPQPPSRAQKTEVFL
jgi:hypothetical protein